MNKDELKLRTKNFAHRYIKLAVSLAHGKSAFTSKISIVIEEADESEFWMQFIIDEKLIPHNLVYPLMKEAQELTSIFISSRKTLQRRTGC